MRCCIVVVVALMVVGCDPGLCTNTCATAHNDVCEDGRSGTVVPKCALGTDCSDCGPLAAESWRRQGLCLNTCKHAYDGECDDGREGARSSRCAFGTDCADCGAIAAGSLVPESTLGEPQAAEELGVTDLLQECSPGEMPRDELCSNTCEYARDDECDDGGPGSDHDLCELGTDCDDCGPRPGDDTLDGDEGGDEWMGEPDRQCADSPDGDVYCTCVRFSDDRVEWFCHRCVPQHIPIAVDHEGNPVSEEHADLARRALSPRCRESPRVGCYIPEQEELDEIYDELGDGVDGPPPEPESDSEPDPDPDPDSSVMCEHFMRCSSCSIEICFDGSSGSYRTSDGSEFSCSMPSCTDVTSTVLRHCDCI